MTDSSFHSVLRYDWKWWIVNHVLSGESFAPGRVLRGGGVACCSCVHQIILSHPFNASSVFQFAGDNKTMALSCDMCTNRAMTWFGLSNTSSLAGAFGLWSLVSDTELFIHGLFHECVIIEASVCSSRTGAVVFHYNTNKNNRTSYFVYYCDV